MNSFTLGIKNHLMNQTEDNSINAEVYHLQFEESLIIYKRQLIQVLKICYSLYKALLEIFLINNDYYCTWVYEQCQNNYDQKQCLYGLKSFMKALEKHEIIRRKNKTLRGFDTFPND